MKGSGLPWLWRLIVATMAAFIAVALCMDVTTRRADDLFYDLHLKRWGYPVDGEVVMVTIDDTSLREIGQWPWPRNVHATLLDRLAEAGVRGAALDLILAEPDRSDPVHDTLLAEAMHRNERVVLPVTQAMQHQSGPLVEVLPNPAIAGRVAALGHTDVELDESGTARDLYLYAGLGEARWPALGLALLQLEPETTPAEVPGQRLPDNLHTSPYQWVRDHHVRIRYAGPPGSFAEIPFLDVLEQRLPAEALRGKWVVVGVTATGLAPGIRTPMSGIPMSGVEYQANVVAMLLQHRAIVPLAELPQAGITGLLVFLSMAFVLSAGVLRPLLAVLGGIGAAVIASVMMLRLGHAWFAPMAAVMTIGLGYMAWMGRHLMHWRRQAHIDTLTRLANRRRFDETFERRLAIAQRSQSPLSLLLIDVDHFKQFNDTEGHLAGDRLLAQVARTIRQHGRRAGDLAARYGGDEFVLLLSATPARGAEQVAKDILADLRAQAVPASLSIGICTCVPDLQTLSGMVFEQADAALYRAKQNGRNGYVLEEYPREPTRPPRNPGGGRDRLR
ncbi:CHASE2 domain-containing protein [Marilutibacter alkalisoli]|uniref:diguanylate cyclase n=1 Tax=Marilutibacter alkalisoli TaxID=2591633 RepID=A0A514BQ25_9GAMM|nr:CHASE2 domain-containing protein [Lysobacter alkalisoli]QDH69493.1 CHASE2 domain-containing protein [Lysobacter alkalisoli]